MLKLNSQFKRTEELTIHKKQVSNGIIALCATEVYLKLQYSKERILFLFAKQLRIEQKYFISNVYINNK